jgi:predicted GTPase
MYSKLTLMTVICPSYEVCKSVLSELKLEIDCKKIRRIILAVGEKIGDRIKNKVNLAIDKDENIKGKRVIVSVDGGRTRTREIKKEINKVENIKHKNFETP